MFKNKKAGETNFLRKKVVNKEITFPRKVKLKSIHLLSDKKAGERILSIYLFIIYIIVGVGIVSGVILFRSSNLDVREIEAGILTDKVIDCLVEQGKLRTDFDENFDLIGECNFNFKDNTKKYQGEERYGVKIESFDFDSGVLKGEIKVGKTSLLTYCGLEGDKIPKCNLKELYVLKGDEKILLKINSVVGKVENV